MFVRGVQNYGWLKNHKTMRCFQRMIIGILVITCLSISYVWLRIEIIKTAYALQYKEKLRKQLVDGNEVLGYAIKRLVSLDNLEQRVVKGPETYEFPRTFQISSLAAPEENRRVAGQAVFRGSMLSRIFNSFGTLAEAKTTK
jgi:hypothetical protein